MANRFNFSDVAKRMKVVENNFLTKGVELAREEMIENINSQSSKESGTSYPELSYLVDWRPKNPPRLVLNGDLFNEIKTNKIRVVGRSAYLVIDPIDERGKGYASYHQEGENQYKSKSDFQAEFVTQSQSLYSKQENLLLNEVQKAFL